MRYFILAILVVLVFANIGARIHADVSLRTEPAQDYLVQEECNGVDDNGNGLVDDDDPSAMDKPWQHPSGGRIIFACDPQSFASWAADPKFLAEFVPVEF